MRDRDAVAGKRAIPGIDAQRHVRVAFALRRSKAPLVAFARRVCVGVLPAQLLGRAAFPGSESDLDQTFVDAIGIGRDTERRAYDLHGGTCATERARDEVEAARIRSVAREQFAQDLAAAARLRAALGVERDIAPALQPALDVPVGLAVADVIEERRGHGRGPRLVAAIPSTPRCRAREDSSCRRCDSPHRRGAPRRSRCVPCRRAGRRRRRRPLRS